MEHFNFTYLNNYKNHGQNAEQSIIFALCGQVEKASNLPCTDGGDYKDYQIKSARATICNGLDLHEHLATDKATAYIYGTNDGIAYIFTKSQWLEFCLEFATVTYESAKNGCKAKLRLRSESKEMVRWLASH